MGAARERHAGDLREAGARPVGVDPDQRVIRPRLERSQRNQVTRGDVPFSIEFHQNERVRRITLERHQREGAVEADDGAGLPDLRVRGNAELRAFGA